VIKFFIVAILLSVFSSFNANACSAVQAKGQKNITILMVNGIGNGYEDACESLGKLKDTLSENGVDVDKNTGFGFDLFHNETEGYVGDINELRIQAALSSEAVKRDSSNSPIGYSFALGALYNNLALAVLDKTVQNPCLSYLKYNTSSPSYLRFASNRAFDYDEDYCLRIASTTMSLAARLSALAAQGNGVVVVAHSQGNFYLEAAYAILRVKNNPNLSKIRGVGVAAISLHPVSDRYLTISQDNALFLAQRKNTEMLSDLRYHPASFTHTACARGANSCSIDDGENVSTLAAVTGSVSFSDTQVAYLGLDSNIALMHEFVEVYLSNNLTDDSSNRMKLPTRISNMVKDSITELTPASSLNLLLGSTVTDSCIGCTIGYNGNPNNLTDGNLTTGRNLAMYSGSFNLFLANPKTVDRLRLLPNMSPNGLVYYEIQTSTDPTGAIGTWTSHGGAKSSQWASGIWFDFKLNVNTQNVRVIKVIVTSTPSWLAFNEIEAYAP
jgi:hypothetical protein